MERFKEGDMVEVLDNPVIRSWNSSGVGHRFMLTASSIMCIKAGQTFVDPDNKFGTNYRVEDVRKVSLMEQANMKFRNGQKVQCLNDGHTAIINGPTHAGVQDGPLFEVLGEDQIWAYVQRASNVCVYKHGVWTHVVSSPEEDDPWGKVLRTNPHEVTTVKEELQIGGYVKITRAGEYGGVYYEEGQIWEITDLTEVGTMNSSGIFVTNNLGTRCQLGLNECEYLGRYLDEINQHFYLLNNSQKNQSNGRTDNNVQLRTTAPQVGQGEGRLESRVQSRKGQIKLAVVDFIDQGSVSYGKTKGGGSKERVPFRLPGNS